jgi:tetratricopeptide (TPR) repeat protein
VNILKGYIEDERILRLYGATSLPETLASEKSLAGKEEEKEVPQKGSTPEKKESIDSLFNDVSSQYYNQQYGKAAEILREGISKYPDNADLYAWYGATLLNMNIPDKAYEQYRKAAELSPDVADFHAGEGLSLLNGYMDRVKGSIEAFKKALAIDPHNVGALEGLGFVYTSIGKKDLATEIYYRLAPLDRNAATRLSDAINNGINWEQNSSR